MVTSRRAAQLGSGLTGIPRRLYVGPGDITRTDHLMQLRNLQNCFPGLKGSTPRARRRSVIMVPIEECNRDLALYISW